MIGSIVEHYLEFLSYLYSFPNLNKVGLGGIFFRVGVWAFVFCGAWFVGPARRGELGLRRSLKNGLLWMVSMFFATWLGMGTAILLLKVLFGVMAR